MTGEANGGGGVTLAFELEAFEALADPQAVFADARQWSRYVGVVGDDSHVVESITRRHGVRQDFEIGELDPQSILSRLKWEADTERYVLVGTDEDDRTLADYVNWEYRSLDDAAQAAGWRLAEDVTFRERVRIHLSHLSHPSLWPF